MVSTNRPHLLFFCAVVYWCFGSESCHAQDKADESKVPSVSVSTGDITLRVITKGTKAKPDTVLKEINLGKGNPAIPPKAPAGKGHDLTEFWGKTAEVEVEITTEIKGTEPVSLSYRLFFATKVAGVDGWVMVKKTKVERDEVTLNPGKSDKRVLEASLPIEAMMAPTEGKCEFYTVLSITATNAKMGKEFQYEVVSVTTTVPWYIKKPSAKQK